MFASYPESEGSDLTSISLPNDQDAHDRGGRGGESQHDRGAQHRRTGADAVAAAASRAVLEAWYPGQEDGNAIAVRAVRRHRSERTSHRDVPDQPVRDPDGVAVSVPRRRRPGRLLRGARCRLPLVRRQARHAAVPVRLRPVVHELPLQPPDRDARSRSSTAPPVRMPPPARAPPLVTVTAASRTPARVRAATWPSCTSATRPSAGEPPRQLEGFQRVTLQPHQSQTVSFTITGHELSYFNTAANGWTLPDGRFSLYVGDSSALDIAAAARRAHRHQDDRARYAAADRARDRHCRARRSSPRRGSSTTGTCRSPTASCSSGFPAGWKVVRRRATRDALAARRGRARHATSG